MSGVSTSLPSSVMKLAMGMKESMPVKSSLPTSSARSVSFFLFGGITWWGCVLPSESFLWMWVRIFFLNCAMSDLTDWIPSGGAVCFLGGITCWGGFFGGVFFFGGAAFLA